VTALIRRIGCVLVACSLSACGSWPRAVSEDPRERFSAADWHQRAADAFRQEGAFDAARLAQARADQARALEHGQSFVDFVIEVALQLWLSAAEPPPRAPTRTARR
jgi:hypothetical protein